MLISADEAFRRFEALWVHAQVRHALAGADVTGWPGSRSAGRLAPEDRVDPSIALLSQPLASGVFGVYRRSAVRFGLAHPPMAGGPIHPGTATLTPTGTDLAELCLRKFGLLPAGNGPLLKILRDGQATAEQLWQVRPDTAGGIGTHGPGGRAAAIKQRRMGWRRCAGSTTRRPVAPTGTIGCSRSLTARQSSPPLKTRRRAARSHQAPRRRH